MLVVPIPTDRYLAHVVDAAKSAGYGALLVVLVRTADARDFHDAIIDDWTSLHDVTGDFVAVLCPDPKNAVGYYPPDVQGVPLTHSRNGPEVGGFGLQVGHKSAFRRDAFNQRFAAPVDNMFLRDDIDDIRENFPKFARALPTGGRRYQQAAFTEAVSRCSAYFGIPEAQLPALLFLCFGDQTAVMVRIKPTMSLYHLSKSIVEGLGDEFPLSSSIAASAKEQLGDVEDDFEFDNRGALAGWPLRMIRETPRPHITGSGRPA
jgi:hypothetical protein